MAERETHLPLTVESLARAYEIAAKMDDAVACYEVLLSMGHEAHSWDPQQDWFGAHMQLAKLYIGRHETQKAPKTLGALLGIWKGADADLPLIKEANSLHQALMREVD